MTTGRHLSENGNLHALILHFGNTDTTIVRGEWYVVEERGMPTLGRRVPDVIIAFDADPQLFDATNGYVISEQGKPPDFVMEVGSRTTGHIDVGEKREDYASLGIPEYWRFDETGGDYQGAPLAGDRLVGGEYEPIPIETLEEGVHQGYSAMLDLHIRWSRGRLEWHDPRTGEPIPNQERERRARMTAEVRERQARVETEMARARERESQSRIRELEEQLRQARQRD